MTELPPPSRLAVAYAPRWLRTDLSLLLLFDQKMATILERSSEPMIAQIKLAWWREALTAVAEKRPKGEPLLQMLDDQESANAAPAMRQLLEAWDLLAGHQDWSVDLIGLFAARRASAVFQSYALWVGATQDVMDKGAQWAINDLRLRFGNRVPETPIRRSDAIFAGRVLRPLSLLALAVTQPSGLRMIWHGLTGR